MNDITRGFPYMPVDLSTHGHRIDSLIFWLHVLMVVLFVGWGIYFCYVLIKFHNKRNKRANYHGTHSHFSTYVEVAVALIEGALLVVLALPLWESRVESMPAPDNAVNVRVYAQQFAWNIHYPGPDGIYGRVDATKIDQAGGNFIGLDTKDPAAKDDVVTNNEMVVPVGKPIVIRLTSLDVIHSFFLPELRVKHDAVPGMVIPVWFEARATSDEFKDHRYKESKMKGLTLTYPATDPATGQTIKKEIDFSDTAPADEYKKIRDMEIACAQLCGNGHAQMIGTFKIVTPEEFDAWLKQKAEEQ